MVRVGVQFVVALCAGFMAMSLATLEMNKTHTHNTSTSIGSLDHASTNRTSLSAPVNVAELSTPNDAVVEIRAASHKDIDHHHKGKHGHPKKKETTETGDHRDDKESQYKHWRGYKKFKTKELSPWLDPSYGSLQQRIEASIANGPPEDRFKKALKRVRAVYRQSFPKIRRGVKCKLFYHPICYLMNSLKHPEFSAFENIRRHPECRCV